MAQSVVCMNLAVKYILALQLVAISCRLEASLSFTSSVTQEPAVCSDTLSSTALSYCRSKNAEGMVYYNNGHYDLAIECFLELLEYDYPPAITNMGISFMNGTGIKQDYARAYRCFLRAAEMGESTAQQHLGAMYALGIYVEQCDSSSYHWFKGAAELGNTKAMNALGHIYLDGKYVVADKVEACRWFRRSALAGDLDGLYEYGLQLAMGDTGYRDEELGTGYACIHSAATKGHRASRKLLMNDALREGNYNAVLWWAKALHMSGDHEGTKVLADCYRYGHGISRSKKVARRLYQLAADRGNEEARLILEKW